MSSKLKQAAKLHSIQNDPKMVLSEAEKATLEILISKQAELQALHNRAAMALSSYIEQAVKSRGLNPKLFGVNLAAGRVLPVTEPLPVVPKADGDGKEPSAP